MENLSILITFAGGLAGALLLGFIAHRLKCSPIVGYLLAGIVVGPFTPGFVADNTVAQQFAEIGVILLLFGIGLRFNLHELFAVWRIAVPGALIQSTMSTMALASILFFGWGWSWTSGIILGLAISVASTVVMALVLRSHHDLHTPIGYIAIGWTVVEDVISVAILLLLPIIFKPAGWQGDQNILLILGVAGLKIVGLIAVVVVLGRWIIPWSLELIEKTKIKELFTLAVLVLAVGIAVGSAKIFGVSMALGAFLAGLAVGRSDFAARAAGDAVPMRDAFAVLFFVSVGMLFDPQSLIKNPLLIATVLIVVIFVKPLSAVLTIYILGRPFAIASSVGAAFSQVGEFSFIVGMAALNLGLISDAGWNALVATSIISIALNPLVYGWSRRWSSRRKKLTMFTDNKKIVTDPNHCILVGYGPIGKIVHKLLIDQGITVTVIDMNLKTIKTLQSRGHKALYGDAGRAEILEEAGISRASSLILSTDIEDASEIVRQVHIYDPRIRILVRCSHLREVKALYKAGATVVAAGEAEVGVALAEAVGKKDSLDRELIRENLYNIS